MIIKKYKTKQTTFFLVKEVRNLRVRYRVTCLVDSSEKTVKSFFKYHDISEFETFCNRYQTLDGWKRALYNHRKGLIVKRISELLIVKKFKTAFVW